MLHSTATPHNKRVAFRAGLASGTIQRLPGAFTPLSVRMIEEKGFEGVYISGAVLSNELGLPDIGLTTLSEVAGRASQIARNTDLPALVDADTGFGEPMNVARTVQMLEDAGLAGLHIEDQGQSEALWPPRRQGGRRRLIRSEPHSSGRTRTPRPRVPDHGPYGHPRRLRDDRRD